MKVLVTGSDGFVGRNLTDALLREQDHEGAMYTIYGADIKHITPLIDGTQGPDLAKESIGIRAVQNREFDVVVHLASSVSTPGSVNEPLQTFRDTVRTAANVLEGCRLSNTPIIITSSVKARDGMTPYGAAKQMVELWAMEYRSAYGLPVIINRPGTIYGPGQEGSPESGWIAWFLKAKDEGKKVRLWGGGNQVRDLLHVSDYCSLLIEQMNNIGLYDTGAIYDVGGGKKNAVSVKEMATWLELKWNKGPARYGDAQEYIGLNEVPGAWEPRVYWRDSEELRK